MLLKTLFFKIFIGWFCIGLILLLTLPKGYHEVFINTYFAQTFWDYIFMAITHIGNGIVFGLIALYFLYKKNYNYIYITAITGILILVFSALGKHILFSDALRPTAFLPIETFPHIIKDFNYAIRFSFPSGHTMTAFASMAVLSFVLKKTSAQIVLFLIAILVGFSRMYLLQHFLIDVFVGSILGYASAYIGYCVLKKRLP